MDEFDCEYRWAGLFKSLNKINANLFNAVKEVFADNYSMGYAAAA